MQEILMTFGMYLNHDMLSRVELLPGLLNDYDALKINLWCKQWLF